MKGKGKPLPEKDVKVRADRTGPARLTASERMALKTVEDENLRRVLGEMLLRSRAVQRNFEAIEGWFPLQPGDVIDSLREVNLEPIELQEEDHTVGSSNASSVVAWLREKLWKSWIEAFRPTGSLYHTVRLVSRWGTSGQAALEVRGSDKISELAGSKHRVLAKVGEDAASILEGDPDDVEGIAARSDFNRWKGAWKKTTTYGVNMVVRNAGVSYVCIKAHTNKEPPNAEYWEVFGTGEAGAAGAEGRSAGLKYTYSTNTESSDPGSGKLKFNKATLSEATILRISETDGDGNAIAPYIATWDDSTSATKGFFVLRKVGSPTAFAVFSTSGVLNDNGTWDSFTVAHVASNGLANSDVVTVEFYRTGDKGETGEKGTEGKEGPAGPNVLEEGKAIEFKEGATLREIITGFKTGTSHVLRLFSEAGGERAGIEMTRDATAGTTSVEVNIGPGTLYRIADSAGKSSFLQLSTARKERDFGLVSALPAEPNKGDRCYYIADEEKGIVWELVYSGSGTKWFKLGGPPLQAQSNEPRTLNNKTAYTSLPTDPLSFTVPLKGTYDIRIEGTINNKVAGQEGQLSYAIGATAAVDSWAARNLSGAQVLVNPGNETRQSAVAAGAKIEEKGRTGGAYEIDFSRRRLWANPVFVE